MSSARWPTSPMVCGCSNGSRLHRFGVWDRTPRWRPFLRRGDKNGGIFIRRGNGEKLCVLCLRTGVCVWSVVPVMHQMVMDILRESITMLLKRRGHRFCRAWTTAHLGWTATLVGRVRSTLPSSFLLRLHRSFKVCGSGRCGRHSLCLSPVSLPPHTSYVL